MILNTLALLHLHFLVVADDLLESSVINNSIILLSAFLYPINEPFSGHCNAKNDVILLYFILVKLAFIKLAPVKFTPLKSTSFKFASFKFTPLKSAFL